MNPDTPMPHTASTAPALPDRAEAGHGTADIGEDLRDALQSVLEEPVPPVLSMLAAELQRRLEAQVAGDAAPTQDLDVVEQSPT